MAARTKTANRQSRLLATAGPFIGVRTTNDAPYTDWSKYLYTAVNGYFRDAAGGSSWSLRPGFVLMNPVAQIGSGTRTQGQHAHVDPATGTIYRFFANDGKIYTSNASLTAFFDVSPVGITITTGSLSRVSFVSVGSSLVVTDGVNRPWVATNLGSTPITGTYIDIDGVGGAWSTWGQPTVYQDSVFFITQTVPGGSAVQPRVGLVWSEPNQPTVGYTQSGYADFWNLIETGSDPVYAILGTNNGLLYWRPTSIGQLSGTPSINFSTTATRDARGVEVGTISPWSVAIYNNNVFFLDINARPWMMPLLGEPQPIWKQGALWFTEDGSPDATSLPTNAVASIVPELNQYVVLTTILRTRLDVFDAESGAYAGQWAINYVGGGNGIDSIGIQRDSTGNEVLCVVGAKALGTHGGYVWTLFRTGNGGSSDSGNFGAQATFTTGYIAFSSDRNIYPDYAVIVLGTGDTVTATVATSYSATEMTFAALTPGATPTSNSDGNGGNRLVVGLDGCATRMVQFTINSATLPTLPEVPGWGIRRIDIYGSVSDVGPEEL